MCHKILLVALLMFSLVSELVSATNGATKGKDIMINADKRMRTILNSKTKNRQFLNSIGFLFQVLLRHVMTTGSLANAKKGNCKEDARGPGLLRIAKRRAVFAQVINAQFRD